MNPARAVPASPNRPSIVAGLDIGSSKVACVIARAEPGDVVDALGVGAAAHAGVRSGGVVDLDAVEHAIREAVETAERAAGAAVSRITVGFSGGQLASRLATAEINLTDREVSDRDLRRALDAALDGYQGEGRSVIHALPVAWSIDDDRGVRDPRGMFGAKLGVELTLVTAASGALRNLSLCIERADLASRAVVAAPYAAALASLTSDEIDLGVTLIDLGAGATSIAVFADGALAHVDVIPVGGGHATNDLARGLSTTLAGAEQLKRRFGVMAPGAGAPASVSCPKLGETTGGGLVTPDAIFEILAPRLEETFELVRRRLKLAGWADAAGRSAALTGGGSSLPGVTELAERVLAKTVRRAGPRKVEGLDLSAPEYSVACGLVRHALAAPRDAALGRVKRRGGPSAPRTRVSAASPWVGAAGGLSRAAAWLRENF